ncbi:hypothetical protein FE784_14645 [Paenibacillus hemerocallicola]|uniref:Rhamnogalacturonase A/B/Epimerase-like pectate lyase domain-containing protein n=1 Tax=Paenibacillus hemerocallicola TaxID=1172614 RepID=A0A5C4TAI6_9BACL|nr:glycosyl hydrolase family 28-related protein [Paenibacillus hemerocallicola]TNJ65457.1 hypothetical protein FE784_14645 [Paenibacillus hemerocallicola]
MDKRNGKTEANEPNEPNPNEPNLNKPNPNEPNEPNLNKPNPNEPNPNRPSQTISRRKMLSVLGISGAALLTAGMSAKDSSGYSVQGAVYGSPEDDDSSCCLRMTTIAELRGMTGPIGDLFCYVVDRGCEGQFYYDASDTATPDNTGLVLVSASGARWKRVHQGEISIAWFGAVGDGATDCTRSIQAALDTGLPVFLPAGAYAITNTLRVKANGQLLRGGGRFATIVRNASNASPLLHFGDNTDPTTTGYALSCAARDFTLEGNALTTEGVAYWDRRMTLRHGEAPPAPACWKGCACRESGTARRCEYPPGPRP